MILVIGVPSMVNGLQEKQFTKLKMEGYYVQYVIIPSAQENHTIHANEREEDEKHGDNREA
jgi:hypothetical protein